MTTPSNDTIFAACARAAHEVNRAYCIAIGDASQVPWEQATTDVRESALNGVMGVLVQGNGPRESHDNWLAFKQADGWVHGETKDPIGKTHPCCVPYDKLSHEQREKDTLFVEGVRMMAAALGYAQPSTLASHRGITTDQVRAATGRSK